MRLVRAAALLSALSAAALLAGAPGQAPPVSAATGSISGRITNNVGGNVAGANVQVEPYDCCDGTFASATTAADGTYTVSGIDPASYAVFVRSAGTYAAYRYYPGSYSRETASVVTVGDGANTPNIDIALEPGATLSGTVTGGGGAPLQNALLQAHCEECDGFGFQYSAANGSYSMNGLPPGDYHVSASASGFVAEYYNNVYDFEDATPVGLGLGGSASNINFALSTGGSISGFVQDVFGAPIGDAEVQINQGSCCNSATTEADGSFTATLVAPGQRTINVIAAGFVSEYYEDGYDFLQATPIEVVEGEDTPDIYVILAAGGTIGGTVRDGANQPIEGAYVNGELATGGGGAFAQTDASGAYLFEGLAPGNYRINFAAEGFAPEYYNNTHDQSAATLIPVSSGSVAANVDAVLGTGGAISGTVTNQLAGGIANANIQAERVVCCASGFAEADANGVYTMTNLPPGQYIVRTDIEGYADEHYNDAYPRASATAVTVTGTATTPNINFSLVPSARITGSVMFGATPLSGALVTAAREGGGAFTGDVTNSAGVYEFLDLPPGNYRLTAEKGGYGREFYQDKYNFASGNLVAATSGATTSAINFALGVVMPDYSSQPIPVPVIPFNDVRSTSLATSELGEPLPCGNIGATIWYQYEVPLDLPGNLSVVADSAGSSFDTVLAVHQTPHAVSPPGGTTPITCNDTNGVSPQARAAFTAVRGETYLIQAGGAAGATGTLNLVISCVSDNDCDAVTNASDSCLNTFNPTQANLDADAQGDVCDADIDGDGCTNEQERGNFRELGGDRNPVNPWDFYDVSGDNAIDFTDTLAVLGLFGTDTSAPEYILSYDRYPPNPAKPWRTALAIDGFGIDLTDALTSLASFGDGCE